MKNLIWVLFWDMHSGGGVKEKPYEKIYIQAESEEQAKVIFYNRFGHAADRISCTCCGEDYSISSSPTLEQVSGYHRGCAFVYFNSKGEEVPESEARVPGKGLKRGYTFGYAERHDEKYGFNEYKTLDQYKKEKDVLIIPASKIKASERVGSVPTQGWVWQ